MFDRNFFAPIWPGLAENKHRQAMGNAVFTFIYLVHKADRKNGELTFQQTGCAEELGVHRNTIGRDLKTLVANDYIEVLESGRQETKIRIKRWLDVRERQKAVNKAAGVHQANGAQNAKDGAHSMVRVLEENMITYSNDSKNRSGKCPNPLGHQDCIEDIDSIQTSYSKKFINYAKQIGSYHQIIRAGFTDDQVQYCLDQLTEDRFYQEKGWDVSTILSLLSKGGKYVRVA